MSALPCPVENPFAAADEDYAAITEFLSSKEAWQVEHSELERELEGKGRELLRKLLQGASAIAPAGPSGGSGARCRGHAAGANRGT